MSTEVKINFSGPIVFEELKGDEWFFGGPEFPLLETEINVNLLKYAPTEERQATRWFDPWSCVSESLTNVLETYFNFLMESDTDIRIILDFLGALDENGKANFSGRWLAKMSGTIPGRGNSLHRVAETVRKFGLVGEKFWPKTDDQTEEEYYAEIPQHVKDLGLEFLRFFDYNHAFLPSSDLFRNTVSNETLEKASKYGAIQVCVDGSYDYTVDGLVGKIVSWNHAACYMKQTKNEDGKILWHDVMDTYNPFFKKFVPDYLFGTPKIHVIKKKSMLPKLYKKKSESAIYALDPETNELVPFVTGVRDGGRVFKTIYGTVDYSKMPRIKDPKTGQDWEKLPFPIASWGVTSKEFNPNA